MTISISPAAHKQLFAEMSSVELTCHPDPLDLQDFMGDFPSDLGKGVWRTITLRDGLQLQLGNLHLHDRYLSAELEGGCDWLELHLHLSGFHTYGDGGIGAGQYGLFGSGLCPAMPMDVCDREAFWEVIVGIRVDALRSFIGDGNGELPPALQPWVRSVDQLYYCRYDAATPAMQLAARQLLRCGFQGLPKRMFLEGKALELLGLVAAAETDRYDGDRSTPSRPYLPNDLTDRIHQARDILRQRLDNPPGLAELSRLVGLNDCTLKQGFRQVFSTTVFGYLHDYRMEQARQLLSTGEMKVIEAAKAVGFVDRSYFAAAFRKKFGYNPSALKSTRN
ncbi:MAG: AraC family transcriptional regulator [Aphanocapsa sp. GSE-SYN-MK-11-07L]|jgi:AraC-like DNA-binding protein|nr:AraC family transcriptional regulator [Aphanocapsa sp. GSE-SYN-MK-11-07L]